MLPNPEHMRGGSVVPKEKSSFLVFFLLCFVVVFALWLPPPRLLVRRLWVSSHCWTIVKFKDIKVSHWTGYSL